MSFSGDDRTRLLFLHGTRRMEASRLRPSSPCLQSIEEVLATIRVLPIAAIAAILALGLFPGLLGPTSYAPAPYCGPTASYQPTFALADSQIVFLAESLSSRVPERGLTFAYSDRLSRPFRLGVDENVRRSPAARVFLDIFVEREK